MNDLLLETNIRNEWRIQRRALGASAYKIIGIKRRPGMKNLVFNFGKRSHNAKERFFNALEVDAMIDEIAKKNQEGFNILIQPIDLDYRFVFLNSVRTEVLGRMKDVLKPCLLLKYEFGNTQAIVKVLPEDPDLTEEMVAVAAQRANNLFAESGFKGVGISIPMAGTWNHFGKKSFVTILDFEPGHSQAFASFAKSVTPGEKGSLLQLIESKRLELNQQTRSRVASRLPRVVPVTYAGADGVSSAGFPKNVPSVVSTTTPVSTSLRASANDATVSGSGNAMPAGDSQPPTPEKSEKALLRELNGVTQMRNDQAQAALENLRAILERADTENLQSFIGSLESSGVRVKANLNKGVMSGLSYTVGNHKFTSRQLGKKYSWSQIEKKVSFSKERDFGLLFSRAGTTLSDRTYSVRRKP